MKKSNKPTKKRLPALFNQNLGFDKAINVMPDMTETTILHAGPPITYENMRTDERCRSRSACFEGLAKDLADADRVAHSGAITFLLVMNMMPLVPWLA